MNHRFAFREIASSGWRAAVALSFLLAACGGGQDNNNRAAEQPEARSAATSEAAEVASSPDAPSSSTIALQQEGARLNTADLEAIAKNGALPKPYDGPLLSGAEGSTPSTLNTEALNKSLAAHKSAASRVPVYRFFNTRTSAHFFTTSETERANVVATQPFMTYEGPAFYASSTVITSLLPVHRFRNTTNGVHFYTISGAERAHIASTMPTFTYEGIAYYASTLPGTGYTPLYRFFYTARGFHFYTTSEAEKNTIIATLPQYSYEGIAYYALGSDWQTPAIPHTGITASQCYKAGLEWIGDCTSPSVLALNPQQDGNRTTVHPMSYSTVSSNPLTSCVKDNVTGLIWEGKTPTGERAGSNTYTNYGDGTANDASAYVNRVNQLNLCGHKDWRLPTIEELQGIVHYGLTVAPRINTSWFPNTSSVAHWTGSAVANQSGSLYWAMDFTNASFSTDTTGNAFAVRLVSGAPWSGPRYWITSVVYAGDGSGNAVYDRKTGLTWRRCLEGQVWGAGTCTGTRGTYTHEGALTQARIKSGWRLPNAKELGSLPDRSRSSPALDPSAFPGGTIEYVWTSTPWVIYPTFTWNVLFGYGAVYPYGDRSSEYAVRLVQIEP